MTKVNAITNDTELFASIGKKNADMLLGKKKGVTFCVSSGNQNGGKYQKSLLCKKTTVTSQKNSMMNRRKLDNTRIHWKLSNHIAITTVKSQKKTPRVTGKNQTTPSKFYHKKQDTS